MILLALATPEKLKDPTRASLDPGWQWPKLPLTKEQVILLENADRTARNLAADPEKMAAVEKYMSSKGWRENGLHFHMNKSKAHPLSIIFSCAEEDCRPASAGPGLRTAAISFAYTAYCIAKKIQEEEK